MQTRSYLMITVTACLFALLFGCAPITPPAPTDEPPAAASSATEEPEQEASPAPIGMANPASQYCTEQGGTLTIEQRGDGGEFGVCTFEDNRQCEEWALMNGLCPVGGIKVTGYLTPAARYCAITGGEYADNGTTSEEDEQGSCTFPGGAICPTADYYDGQCTP